LRGHLSGPILIQTVAGAVALLLPATLAILILHSLPVGAPKIAAAPAARQLPLLPSMAAETLAANDAPAASFDPSYASSSTPDPLGQNVQGAPSSKPAAPSLLVRQPAPAPAPKPKIAVSPLLEIAPAPPRRPTELVSLASPPLGHYDHFTAIYDLSAHTVYMPDGGKLEAHSGLGDREDDPLHVNERDRGATPPHLYDLTLREQLFHGVQALRLTPIGGGIFGRDGILAHSYMLGPNGDSNGCVSFKNYDAFLQAFQSGQVKHLAVVASLAGRTKLASAALDH
jgi:hypothetical protein